MKGRFKWLARSLWLGWLALRRPTDLHRLMAAIRRLDLEGAEWAERIFTGLIRYFVARSTDEEYVMRAPSLGENHIFFLCAEMAGWLARAEQADKFGYTIREAFAHFFIHVALAMDVLKDLPFLTEEELHEVRALAALADELKDLFRTARIVLEEGETASLLKQHVREWGLTWYPAWGVGWLPL